MGVAVLIQGAMMTLDRRTFMATLGAAAYALAVKVAPLAWVSAGGSKRNAPVAPVSVDGAGAAG